MCYPMKMIYGPEYISDNVTITEINTVTGIDFHAVLKHEDRAIAWMHGTRIEEDVIVYAIDSEDIELHAENRILLSRSVESLYAVDDLVYCCVEDWMHSDDGFPQMNFHRQMLDAGQYVSLFDWELGQPQKKWVLEGTMLDHYTMGFYSAQGETVARYPHTLKVYETPYEAYRAMVGHLGTLRGENKEVPYFIGTLSLRPLFGNVLRYVHQGSNVVHQTDSVNPHVPVRSRGMMTHLEHKYLTHGNYLPYNKIPEEWDENRQRILLSVKCALGDANLTDKEQDDAIHMSINGNSIYEIVEDTGKFPSQEHFTAAVNACFDLRRK